jgi:hypothetical protein
VIVLENRGAGEVEVNGYRVADSEQAMFGAAAAMGMGTDKVEL